MHDVAVVGAGAAGLATAIFTRRFNPARSVLLLDGARRPGAKILVSGGSRCNVTNAVVTEADFWGGRRTIVRRVLRAFSVADTVAFFARIGVALHEEPGGKLFPDSNRSRDVRDALLREAAAAGVELRCDRRVLAIERVAPDRFEIVTAGERLDAVRVVLATGGLSLPKTGSDGAGLAMARALGHTIVPTTPALVPLVLDGTAPHRELSGVSHEAEIAVWVDGAVAIRLRGSLLWTHFGISGPVALDASRHWLRAGVEGRDASLTVSFCPDESFDDLDARLASMTTARPTIQLQTALATMIPSAVAIALARHVGIDPAVPLAHLTRDARRRMVHGLTALRLPVVGSRGYTFAEVTAGGVTLTEIDPATMESRICQGLFLVGELLDVDGRLGGFNFQWAWSSAHVAARALASRQP